MSTPTHTHVACTHCGATNRIPDARLGEDPVCGRCGQALLAGAPLDLGDPRFAAVTTATELPVLVDFWAPWCGPCHSMAPQFAQAAAVLKGQALLLKVNSDDNPATAARFAIRSIPTLVKLRRGVEVGRLSGVRPAQQIVDFARS